MEAIPAIVSVDIAERPRVHPQLDPEQEFNGTDRVIHRISASPERGTAW